MLPTAGQNGTKNALSNAVEEELQQPDCTQGMGGDATAPGGQDATIAELHQEGSDGSEAERDLELPQVAGNLSPRLVATREVHLNNSLMELNIDSVSGNAK